MAKLIELCRVLEETPTDQLPAALEPICDVDGLLWFLALDVGLINSDGYWIRASDYSIYLDEEDRFHFIPHDMNEAFRAAGGRGMPGPAIRGGPAMRGGPGMQRPDDLGRDGPDRGRPGRGGPAPGAGSPVELDPLVGLDDRSKPLRSKVLAVPKYREQYLRNVRELAENSLDWKTLGPVVAQAKSLIDDAVKDETRKLSSYEAFLAATSESKSVDGTPQSRGGHGAMNLKAFADARRTFLLEP